MPVTTGCPDIQQYRRLIGGQLSAAEADTLLAHLEGCAACARQVAAIADQDSLAKLVREAGSRSEAITSERLSLLVQRLRKQQPTAHPALPRHAAAEGHPAGSHIQPPAPAARKA